MQITTTLTATQVAKLKAKDSQKYAGLPDGGYSLTYEKPQFDYGFADFIKWLTGAEIEVISGDPSVAQKLMIEHAKFALADRIRAKLAEATYDESGQLTPESYDSLMNFINDWKYIPGRQSALASKSPEELEKEKEKLMKKLAALEAMLS